MVDQKENKDILCEPKEGGWRCLRRPKGKWIDYGDFDAIVIKDKKVELPIVGKVIFDGQNCEIREEHGMKILYCKEKK